MWLFLQFTSVIVCMITMKVKEKHVLKSSHFHLISFNGNEIGFIGIKNGTHTSFLIATNQLIHLIINSTNIFFRNRFIISIHKVVFLSQSLCDVSVGYRIKNSSFLYYDNINNFIIKSISINVYNGILISLVLFVTISIDKANYTKCFRLLHWLFI